MQDPDHELIRGKLYRYDADFDAYYRVYEESTVSRWLWIPVCILLALLCWIVDQRY
jgi:hypothetical protein